MMNKRNPGALKYFLAAIHPDQLIAAFLFYALGTGLVHFLGNAVDQAVYWIGQGMVTLIQLSGYFLFAYFNFDALEEQVLEREWKRTGEPVIQNNRPDRDVRRVLRLSFLQAGLTTLTIGAVLTVMMSFAGRIDAAVYLIIGLALAAALSLAVPPANFGATGYGDLVTSLFLAILTPAFAYVLQSGEMHRLLTLLGFPLGALTLASFLALSLEGYRERGLPGKMTMMRHLGWQKGIQLHNILIFLAYLLFGGAVFIGLPWALAWPALLSLPVGLFQVWQLRQISAGVKPRWRLLRWTACGLVAVTVYLISLALWTS